MLTKNDLLLELITALAVLQVLAPSANLIISPIFGFAGNDALTNPYDVSTM